MRCEGSVKTLLCRILHNTVGATSHIVRSHRVLRNGQSACALQRKYTVDTISGVLCFRYAVQTTTGSLAVRDRGIIVIAASGTMIKSFTEMSNSGKRYYVRDEDAARCPQKNKV